MSDTTATAQPQGADAERPRRSKQSLGALVISIIALVVAAWQPIIVPAIDHFRDPRVTFTYPKPGTRLATNIFGAWGTASHIPASSALWLIVRSGIEGRFYPVRNLPVSNGTWTIGSRWICPAPGLQDLQIYLVPNSD